MKFIILVTIALSALTFICAEDEVEERKPAPRQDTVQGKSEDFDAHVESTDFKINDDGGFKYGYKTSNNIKLEEESDGQNVVEGSYSYVDPDGRTHTVTYIAGAGIGFQPTGDDIHPEVSAGIELNLKNPPLKTEEKKDEE